MKEQIQCEAKNVEMEHRLADEKHAYMLKEILFVPILSQFLATFVNTPWKSQVFHNFVQAPLLLHPLPSKLMVYIHQSNQSKPENINLYNHFHTTVDQY